MILNGDFEEGFTEREAGELKVAVGWEPWWDERDTRPEFKDAAPFANRIHTGAHAQQLFTKFATHTGGVYQIIYGTTPGSTLYFSAWVQAWSQMSDGSLGRYRMKIGIDPYGLVDPESHDVVWSNDGNAVQPYDKYQKLEVETLAKSDRCTVFVWGQAEWRVPDNNAYVDNAQFSVIGEPVPQPGLTEERVRQIVRAEMLDAVAQLAAILA